MMTTMRDFDELEDNQVSLLIRALTNWKRVEILRFMTNQAPGAKVSPKAYADIVGADLRTYSYHFQVLARCRAIKPERTGRRRRAGPRLYSFNADLPWPLIALHMAERANDTAGRSDGKDSET